MGVPIFVRHAACVRDTRRCTPQYRLAEPPRLLNLSRYEAVQHHCMSCAVPLALLQREMALLILLATAAPTGRVPPELPLPTPGQRSGHSGGAGASGSQGSCATKRRRAASACAHLACCVAVKEPPKSSIA